MSKDRDAVTCNGRPAFYAAMYEDLRKCAMGCGWALALHGSLASDMDLMAMPWEESAVGFELLVKKLSECFSYNNLSKQFTINYSEKAHGRVVATIPIWSDFYLDISTIYRQPDALGELLKFCREKKISVSIRYDQVANGYTFKAYDEVTNNVAGVHISSIDLRCRNCIGTIESQLVEHVKTILTRLLHLDLSEFDRKVKKFTREICPDAITIHPIPGETVRLTGEDARKYWEEHKED